jgi:hypothetical protein
MNKTTEVFLQEMQKSLNIKNKIIENVRNENKKEMTLNLFDLDFDFERQMVLISYYVEDKDYLPVTLTCKEFVALLQGS